MIYQVEDTDTGFKLTVISGSQNRVLSEREVPGSHSPVAEAYGILERSIHSHHRDPLAQFEQPMGLNMETAPRVFAIATDDTATGATELTTKPERRCKLTIESRTGGDEIIVATNVPWAYGHVLKTQLEGLFELALGLQEQPPPPPRTTHRPRQAGIARSLAEIPGYLRESGCGTIGRRPTNPKGESKWTKQKR